MQYVLAALAGIIQGVTEFLPISSSGHLVIFHEMFRLNLPDDSFFDVMLHLGTFLALLLLFWRDIEKIIRGFFSSLFNWNWSNNYNQRLAWLVIIGIIPAVVAGYFLDDLITNYLRSGLIVAIMLIVVGILFFVVEKKSSKNQELPSLKPKNAFIIGLAQAIALIPGTSRSGITIIAGLTQKMKREAAAKFSFLLSMPVILGAGMKKLIDVPDLSDVNWLIMLIGFVTATIFGYLAVKFLLKFLSKHSLNVFGWYRIILGIIIIVWIIIR
jgi:undecaprenyl-diphosphatase